MKLFAKCTFFSLLFLLVSVESFADAGVSRELALFRKAAYSDVRYHLFFSIPRERSKAVTGIADITVTLKEQQSVIVDFRGQKEQILSLVFDGKETPYEFKEEHITIAKVEAGVHRLSISFRASDQSLNRRDDFLYTLLVPDRARTLFPCFDQPDIKAHFTLELEIPTAWKAVGNGPLEKSEAAQTEGRTHLKFHTTEPLSTYLFAFVVGDFKCESFSRDGRSVSIYHRENDSHKASQCSDIAGQVFDDLKWMEDYTGIDYPFAKYDLIIIPGFQYGGMEHTGATLYSDRRIFLNEHPTLAEQLGRTTLIAHETAHLWFGDDVTMKWFDDVWTKEVFANWFASQMAEPQFPQVNHQLNFVLDYFPSAYAEDRTDGTNPIRQPLDNLNNAGLIYGNIVYDKSPIVMDMLANLMGKEAFKHGLQDYLRAFAYSNADWDDFIRVLNKYAPTDLRTFSQVWVNEKGMPEITAELRDGRLVVRQHDSFGRGLVWPQTIFYRLESLGHSSQTVKVTFDGKNSVVSVVPDFPIEKSTVIVPNSGGKGYGFFRVDSLQSEQLFSILANEGNELLRASLLITLHENLLHHNISPKRFMVEMSDCLSHETNSLIFGTILGYMCNCQRLFPTDATSVCDMLLKIASSDISPQLRLQAFRSCVSMSSSAATAERLWIVWHEQKPPKDCTLSENDYIGLSYRLAILLPGRAENIVQTQLARITNPDRRREYLFISPAVSPQQSVRDSVFTSLLKPENRRVEPWASSALAFLNDRMRQSEAIKYIRPALDELLEVQRTGDIFFPTSWLRSLLYAHTSSAARKEVEYFLIENPNYPSLLKGKLLQQAGHLLQSQ